MKIAILQLGTFGDLILSTPITKALKEKYPNCSIWYIAGRRNHQVLINNPYVDNIIVWDKSPTKVIKTLLLIKKNKFDYYVDPKDHYSTQGRIIARLVNARTKIGCNIKCKTFDISIPPERENTQLHFVQRVFQAFNHLGIQTPQENAIPKPLLFPTDNSKNFVNSFLENHQIEKFIVFNISASNFNKMFELRFLLQSLRQVFFPKSLNVVLTFTQNHLDYAKELLNNFSNFIAFNSRNFHDVIALIQKSAGVITPDTSIVHVACAFEKPLLAFYSGLDDFFTKFHPIGNNVSIVRAKQGDDGIHSINSSEFIDSFNRFMSNLMEDL